MCHRDDYAHLLEFEPSPEERAAMAAIQEPERRPRDVSGPFTEYAPSFLAGLPAAEDAFAFARGLVFGQSGARIACQRPSFDPHWCIVHSDDFADGASACESAR